MQHFPKGARPDSTGPESYFTGNVTLTPIIEAQAPARIRAASVTFAAGARTFWHTHPLGQTIFVTSGRGRAQTDGGEVIELSEGDTVWFAPGERHWHGAALDTPMTHIAMQEALDGSAVTWLEEVAGD